MQTYDEERDHPTRSPRTEQTDVERSPGLPARRGGRPVNPGQAMALQRAVGNSATVQLLRAEEEEPAEQTEHSPVLDVVGKGGGRPLQGDLREGMEQALGHNFSDVRVHHDAQAAHSAHSVGASAYTVGSDIVLGADHPDMHTSAGQRTLAHELTHVVQQRSGPVDGTVQPGGIKVSDPSDRFEREAEHTADRVMAGHENAAPGPDSGGGTEAGVLGVQRQEEEDEKEDEE